MRATASIARTIPASVILLILAINAVSAFAGPLEDADKAYHEKNYEAAIAIWRPLAEAGNPVAQLRLGQMYVVGLGVAVDAETGANWIQKSAEQEDPEAQDWLGACYRFGTGVPRNLTLAAKWYEKAANHGNQMAMGSLGTLYAAGAGVPKDLVTAYKWLELAIQKPGGNPGIAGLAAMRRDKVAEQMTADEVARAKEAAAAWAARGE